jgi:hypothetical protein
MQSIFDFVKSLGTDPAMDDRAKIIKDLDRQGINYELKNDGR